MLKAVWQREFKANLIGKGVWAFSLLVGFLVFFLFFLVLFFLVFLNHTWRCWLSAQRSLLEDLRGPYGMKPRLVACKTSALPIAITLAPNPKLFSWHKIFGELWISLLTVSFKSDWLLSKRIIKVTISGVYHESI